MAAKKQLKDRLKSVLTAAKAPKPIAILHMPDLPDTAPHWLFWLFVLSVLALILAVGWSQLPTNSALQTYLPTI